MIAFDTNLLVRLVVNDNEKQAEIAEHLLETNQVFIPYTVLLETEWVLRSIYKKTRHEISNLFIENSIEIKNAIEWYDLGEQILRMLCTYVCVEKVKFTHSMLIFVKPLKNWELHPNLKYCLPEFF